MRRGPALALLALLPLAVTGCTPQPSDEPTVIADPVIEVEVEGSSPLDSDPWVLAARAADLGYILATNSGDFTVVQYTGTRIPLLAELEFGAWHTSYVSIGGQPQVIPGPSILAPIEVVEADGGAAVSFCDASSDWFVSASHPRASYDLDSGTVTEYRLTADRLVERRTPSTESCAATEAEVGRFVPEPEVPATWTEDRVRAPLGID